MRGRGLILAAAVVAAVVLAAVAGSIMAVLGASFGDCQGGGGGRLLGGGGGSLGVPPTRAALKEVPPARLLLYRQAGGRFGVEWPFLASIGYQECGTGTCAHVYPSGCGGPMQIAIERESACSPGPGPTIWERYGVDGDGDGRANPFDPADAIFTAARMMRPVFGLAGGSFADYQQAACNYYGACSDSLVSYAAEVMARAVRYGFRGGSSPGQTTEPLPASSGAPSCEGNAGERLPTGAGPMGPVHRATAPRHLAPLPSPPASSPEMECDARIVPDVVYLARRFGLLVTACFGIHAPDGEHPLGAAIDAVPQDGNWNRTMRAARAIGWRPSCAVSGVAPECARPPFRFIGYNGYPDHGDPAHCFPCGGGAHLHISWLTSASLGEPENRMRYRYEPAAWIEVFATDEGSQGGSPGGPLGGPQHVTAQSRRRLIPEPLAGGPEMLTSTRRQGVGA